MSSNSGVDIQSVIGLVVGIAIVVERLLEVFWIFAKFILIKGLSVNFKDFENRYHKQYVRYKKFKEVISLFIGVALGIACGHWVVNQGIWNNNIALMEGAIGGFLSPHAHKLVAIVTSHAEILSARSGDTKRTKKMKLDIEKAINTILKEEEDVGDSACCFLWPPRAKWWREEMNIITGGAREDTQYQGLN